MTKSEPKPADFVFDDDTDDSDDDLVEFRKNIGKVTGGIEPASDTDDDSGEEDGENEEEDVDDEESEGGDSSEGSDDSESDESESEKVEREKANSAINNKLGKLSSLLTKDEESSGSEEEEEEKSNSEEEEQKSDEESSDDADEDFSSKSTIPVKIKDLKIPSEKDNDSGIKDNDKNGNAAKKRKFVDSLGKDGDDSTENVSSEKVNEKVVEYRNNLSKLSVQEILKIKEELGDKLFNSRWSGNSKPAASKQKAIVEFKRDNKNRPKEISSKIKPRNKRMKPVIEQAKRDPRFDPLCGEFDKKEFRSQYSFVDDVKSKELKLLKSQLKESHGEERNKIKYLVQRLENQERSKKIIEDKMKKADKERLEMKEKVERGEQIFFKDKKTLKEEELVEKYEKLKQTGRVDKYIQKKSKKNTSRDRKVFKDVML